MLKTVNLPILLLLSVFFFASCMQRRVISKGIIRTPEQKSYRKIDNSRLKLKLVSRRRSFYAGEDVKLRYRLRNLGRAVSIPEWRMDEGHNIRIYYYKLAKGEKIQNVRFDPAVWTRVEPKYPKVNKRSPLCLDSHNMVFIEKPLPFIAKIKRVTAAKDTYLIVGELTLRSLSLRTAINSIEVR